jgi:ketosteroid isomerase-like protein
MTDEERADMLRQAVVLTADLDMAVLDEIFAEDAVFWSPGRVLNSRDELADELRTRDEIVGDLEVEISALDIAGYRGYAEWVARATHVGPIAVDDHNVIEPTGEEITVRGVTVADFDGSRIVALRQYWDELALLEALGLLPDDDD